MPLVTYFAVVGWVLLGLMFAGDAYLSKPKHLSFTSNFDGLPAAYRGEPAHTAAVAAPHIAAVPLAAETTAQAPAPEPPPAAVAEVPAAHDAVKPAKPAKRKVARVRKREDGTGYADNGRHELDFAWRGPQQPSWREPSQEPSWRDSWASGAFEQRRDYRPRRNDWRQNDGFWFR